MTSESRDSLLLAPVGRWRRLILCSALYSADRDRNINTLEHFCPTADFGFCHAWSSWASLMSPAGSIKIDCWQMNTKLWVISRLGVIWLGVLYNPFCFVLVFFLSCNLCQNSLTSFVFYFVWLQQSVCSHLQWIDIICPWPSVGPHSSAKHHVLLCSFLIFFFLNSECVFFSFANKCFFKTQVVRFRPR